MAQEWIIQWSVPARDRAWQPVNVVVGLLHTEAGVRFAVVVDDKIGVLVPHDDRDLVDHAAEIVGIRERGEA